VLKKVDGKVSTLVHVYHSETERSQLSIVFFIHSIKGFSFIFVIQRMKGLNS